MRDTCMRWALKGVGQSCEVRPMTFAQLKEPDYLLQHPFGKIPAVLDRAPDLFETGATTAWTWPNRPSVMSLLERRKPWNVARAALAMIGVAPGLRICPSISARTFCRASRVRASQGDPARG